MNVRYLLVIIITVVSCMPFDAIAQRYDKMSGFVRNKVLQLGIRDRMKRTDRPSSHRMCVLVKCDSENVLHTYGADILASWGDIHIVTIPLNNIGVLSKDKSVLRIEANAPCSATVDLTAPLLNVDKVWNPSQIAGVTALRNSGYTGKGVIVGVQDVGFDLTHPTFYSSDGSRYRIKSFWDMIEVPKEASLAGSVLPVGCEYTTESDILSKAHSTDNLIISHGTHTAGTAAGSGFTGCTPSFSERSYIGMAPDADIVLVNNAVGTDIPLIPEELRELYTTSLDLLGFKYIFDYADYVGKPCVINFSEGSHQDFYDNILYDEVLRQLAAPGHIIVASAGNEGQKRTYLAQNQYSPQRGREGVSSLYYNDNNYAFLTFCSQGDINFKVIFDALGASPVEYHVQQHDTISVIDTLTVGDAKYHIETHVYPNCYDADNLAGEIYIEDLSHTSIGSDLQRLAFTIPDSENNTTELFYYAGQFITRDEYPSDAVSTHNIHFPGSSEHVICVGMTGYRPGVTNYLGTWMEYEPVTPGSINRNSSIGPALSGQIKPDICAPGVNVISSYSSYYLENNPTAGDIAWDVEHFDSNGRTYAWNSNTGTSMSAPVITGIIALWLEACPTLTREQIMETVAATATHYDPSLTYPNTEYGYGEVDALAGMEYILTNFVTGIETASLGQTSHDNTIYDLHGRRIATPLQGHLYIRNGVTFVSNGNVKTSYTK